MIRNRCSALGLVAVLGMVFSANVFSTIVGNAVFDDVVYFAEDGTDSDLLLRYDIATGSTLSSFTLSEAPTAIAADDLGVYLAIGKSLYRYTFSGNTATATLLRNFAKEIKQIHPVSNYLLVVAGNPNQTVAVLERADGVFVEETEFLEDEFGIIGGIHYSPGSGNLIVNFAEAVDGTVFLTMSFDTSSGDLGAYTDSLVAAFSSPFYSEGANLIVGENGEVVEFNTTNVVDVSPVADSDSPLKALLSHEFFYSDGVIKFAFDDTDSMLVGSTIDNSCHGYDGGTTIRRLASGASGGVGFTATDIYDVNANIHTLVADGADYLMFSGESSALTMQRLDDLDDPEFFGSGDFTPLTVNFTPDQHLSAVSRDGDVLMMHIEATCDRHIVRWDMANQMYLSSVNMQLNKPVDVSYGAEENQFYSLSNVSEALYLRYVDFDVTPPVQSVMSGFSPHAGVGNQVVATDDHVVLSYNDEGEMLVVFNTDGTQAQAPFANTGAAWDVAVWDSNNDRVFYLSDSSLFSVVIAADGSFGVEVKSLDYGVTQEASTDSEIVLNGDGTLLMVGGVLYNAATLAKVDAIQTDANLATWLSTTVFALNEGDESDLEKSERNIGTDPHFGLPTSTELDGTNVLLFTMVQDGVSVPFTLNVDSSTNALIYRTHGTTSTTATSVTLGGNGSSGDGADSTDTTTTETTAEPIGGTGGGGIGLFTLLLLATGVSARRKYC